MIVFVTFPFSSKVWRGISRWVFFLLSDLRATFHIDSLVALVLFSSASICWSRFCFVKSSIALQGVCELVSCVLQ